MHEILTQTEDEDETALNQIQAIFNYLSQHGIKLKSSPKKSDNIKIKNIHVFMLFCLMMHAKLPFLFSCGDGFPLNSAITIEDIMKGDVKSLLDLLWVIILHFTIHSKETPPGRRTLRYGRLSLMEWCADQLTEENFKMHKSITEK
ncbi:hypothetical protein BSL78_02655 [Apostichopus japonicus]|uniref:Uncharacterized protein n=1 Tax=Stichopus japonicus TaxID=307972 RepID=A0A2G8LJJ2_STIJA|nr:hypothetical protein BSL78_02655 [Apostichopus japonicus]